MLKFLKDFCRCLSLLFCLALAGAPLVFLAPAQSVQAAQAAQAARHPVDGTWVPDLAASNKLYRLSNNLPAHLRNLSMTLNAKSGKMLLSWTDGSKVEKSFKFLAYTGRVYKVSISGYRETIVMDLSHKGELHLLDEQNVLVFRRKAAK